MGETGGGWPTWGDDLSLGLGSSVWETGELFALTEDSEGVAVEPGLGEALPDVR